MKVYGLRGEESAYFARAYMGSSALVGRLTDADLATPHAVTGRPLAACMSDVGADVARIARGEPLLEPSAMAAWLELHIEQGPVLVARELPVGIVTGIRGNIRHRVVECSGEAGHSGAIPRWLRRDAVFATAELVSHLDRHWRTLLERGHDLVVTSGIMGTDAAEHAIARIPGTVRFSFEARSQSVQTLEAFYDLFVSECAGIGEERGVTFTMDRRVESAPATLDRTGSDGCAPRRGPKDCPTKPFRAAPGTMRPCSPASASPARWCSCATSTGRTTLRGYGDRRFPGRSRGTALGDPGGGPVNLDALFTAPAPGTMRPDRVTIRRPDDWHVHLRDGAMLAAVLPFTAAQFKRGIVMPNLVPPVTTAAAADSYRQRILAARPAGSDFEPLMTCYLTDATTPEEIERGWSAGIWDAAKLYPAGATTNSHAGVTSILDLAPVFARMEQLGMKLLIHGEATDPAVDIFDREAVFMEREVLPLLTRHPGLKVVIEHATTAETLDIVRAHVGRAAATLTPHHLVLNRTSIFQGGLRPHLYCLPVAKRERHRLALRRAATGGEACFFIGTDTAPHLRSAKERDCCSAGAFVGAAALQIYAQVFDEDGALDRFEAFAALNGARFYGRPVNEGTITLVRRPSRLPEAVSVGDEDVVVFRGGETLPWSIEEVRP